MAVHPMSSSLPPLTPWQADEFMWCHSVTPGRAITVRPISSSLPSLNPRQAEEFIWCHAVTSRGARSRDGDINGAQRGAAGPEDLQGPARDVIFSQRGERKRKQRYAEGKNEEKMARSREVILLAQQRR